LRSSHCKKGPGFNQKAGTIRSERIASVIVVGFKRVMGVLIGGVPEVDIFVRD